MSDDVKDYQWFRDRAPNFRDPESPFGKNAFIINNKRQHLFASIAKGGCSNLRAISAQDDNVKFKTKEDLHAAYSSQLDGKHTTTIDDPNFDDYTKVAFFRDPVKRFISWYYDKVVFAYQDYIVRVGLYEDGSFERTMDFLRFELGKKDPLWIDEHVRPQSSSYDPAELDHIVMLEDMDDYLESIGIPKPDEHVNSSKRTDRTIPDWVEAEIKKIYADDYEMIKIHKDKVWKKN